MTKFRDIAFLDTRSDGTAPLAWNDGTNRFHVWVNLASLELEGSETIYKNPIDDDAARRTRTGHLNPKAAANAAMLATVFAFVREHDLAAKAIDADAAMERAKQRHLYVRAYAIRLWKARMYRHPEPARPDDISESDVDVYSAALARDLFPGTEGETQS